MPLDLRPGAQVPIPCRHCHKAFARFTVAEGVHSLPCPRCGASTEVEVYSDAGVLRIRTAPGEAPERPAR
jgi:phage FluMu protein Com